jgi:hypothetical protein
MHTSTTFATWGCRLAAAAVIALGALLPATLNAADIPADYTYPFQESSLWDEAQKFSIVRPLNPKFGSEGPAGDPYPYMYRPYSPGPTFKGPMGEGVNISNERVKSSLWGTPDMLVISVGKTDVWNRVALSNSKGKKPVGQLQLLAGDFSGAAQPQCTTTVHNGVNAVRLTKGTATADLQFLLTRKETNVFAIKAVYSNCTKPVLVRLNRHCDKFGELVAPESGNDGVFFWIHQKFAAEKTFPKGFDYYFMAKIVGENAAFQNDTKETGLGAPVLRFRDTTVPGSAATAQLPTQSTHTVVIYATVVTTAEAADPFTEAKNRLNAATATGFSGLETLNQSWYRDLYTSREKGRIFTGDFADVKNVILPFIYQANRQSRHAWDSNPDPTRYEGDACYNCLESDEVRWCGLFCFNEEMYTGDFVAGRNETATTYYVNLFNFWRPAFEAHAAAAGLPGMYMLHTIPPIKNDVYWSPSHSFAHGTKDYAWANIIWAFKSVWDEYDYGGRDDAFLRDSVYPCMRGIADFYAAKAILGSDGYYHIDPSMIREEAIGRDAIDCVAAFKWTFKNAIKASQILNVDADKRAVWQDRLNKMKPYYLIQNADGKYVWASIVKNNTPVVAGAGTVHFTVNVADEFNLESTEEEKQICIESNRFHYKAPMNRQVDHLLGRNRDTLCGGSVAFAYPAWLAFYALKAGIDVKTQLPLTTHAQKTVACWLEPERLCNSRSGTIFFFPCVPGNLDVAFKDFQARGGFLVSGELKSGAVTYALVKARRTDSCAVMNPWPGKQLAILLQPGNTPVAATHSGEKYRFAAQAGKSYLLSVNLDP